jgi:SAM-dependent methyltransferase
MSAERRPCSRLLIAAIIMLAAALAVLLYRDFREPPESADRRNEFELIYSKGLWATDVLGKGTSGDGSTLGATRVYRTYLQDFLAKQRIRSVVDAGCGDWEFSQAIDWTGIDYVGLDIVPYVIAANQRRFGAANIRFAVADIVRDELPPADLLLVKDVLQHLSNADIARFLAQLPRYRHVVLVNDVLPDTLSAEPADIPTGRYRPLDLTKAPYSLPGAKVLTWHYGGVTKLVVYLKRAGEPALGDGARPPTQK